MFFLSIKKKINVNPIYLFARSIERRCCGFEDNLLKQKTTVECNKKNV